MPWTVSDVDKHKKGLTSEQKKEWVKVANGILAQCIKDGGTDKTCAPKAIRIANSKFSEEEEDQSEFGNISLNGPGYSHAKGLIGAGKVNKSGSWSISTEERKGLTDNMFLGSGRKYPFGKNGQVYRSGVIAAEQRAAQQGASLIASAAKTLLGLIDGGKNKQSVPKGAFSFIDPDASISFIQADETKNIDLIGYSGGVIKNHWWWGNLGIELSGIKFEKKFYPILEDHQTDKKIGFSQKPDVSKGNLSINYINFVDTDCSAEFQRLSKTGFPYQASISIRPSIVEQVAEGTFAEFNGQKLKGPGTIFRESIYKETSVCVFGYDSKTKSRALSADMEDTIFVQLISNKEEEQREEKNEEVKEKMTIDLEKLKMEDPDSFAKLMEEAQKEVETKLNEGITKMVTDLKSSLDVTNQEVARLNKEITIRDEKDRIATMSNESSEIWETKLKASCIPEHIHTKVQSLFGYDKFVKEGKLDTETFTLAVDAEIKYWVENLGINKQVIGGGFSKKEIDEEAQNEARLIVEDDKWVKNMLGFVGQVAN